MATKTTNYNLTKPSYSEDADISVINSNMDIIDSKMKEIENKAGSGGGGSSVSWNQIQTTGSKIAEVTIDGTTTEVYAPSESGGGGGSGSEIYIDTTLTSGSTQTVVTDSRLKTTSIIDLYTSDSTFEYTSMTLADGFLSIEYDELSSDLSAKVVVRNV